MLDPAFTVLSNGGAITCTISASSCSAVGYTLSNWVILDIHTTSVADSATPTIGLSIGLKSPDNISDVGYAIEVILSDGSNYVYEQKHTMTLATMTANTSGTLAFTSSQISSLYTNMYDIDLLTITPGAGSDQAKRIDIFVPAEYQWVDAICTTSPGSGTFADLSAKFPVSCVSDCTTIVCNKVITIT